MPAPRLNLGLLSDLLLWVVVLALAGWGLYDVFVAKPTRSQQVIHVAFRDANEVTRGSTVRMMGTEIGFVDAIRIRPEDVEVVVKTHPGAVQIPSGSTFTIQFTGLVGAKSIEIIPPAVPRPLLRGKPQYFVEEPIRLKDTNKYQIDIARALQRGSENFSDFFGKRKPVEELQWNIQQSKDGTAQANHVLAKVNTDLRETERSLHPFLSGFAANARDFALTSRETAFLTDPSDFKRWFYGALETTGLTFIESQAALVSFQVDRRFLRLQDNTNKTIATLGGLTGSVSGANLESGFEQVNGALFDGFCGLTRTNRALDMSYPQRAEALRQNIQSFNAKLQASPLYPAAPPTTTPAKAPATSPANGLAR